MSVRRSPLEFDAVIDPHGKIVVPNRAIIALGARAGATLKVRLIPADLSGELERQGVTDEEIDQIAAVQLEDREQVIAFLRSEGALARKPRRARKAGSRL
ncbi:MAG: hypothetical protein AB1428_12495 [Bacteroidota bacterium]